MVKMKRFTIYGITTILAISAISATPAAAFAHEVSDAGAEVYVLDQQPSDSKQEDPERGRCTDSYSKEWCDSHGFKNNRPVPHAVKLTKQELACYYGLIRNGVSAVTALVKKSPLGVAVAVADVAFTLWTCKS